MPFLFAFIRQVIESPPFIQVNGLTKWKNRYTVYMSINSITVEKECI